jgi:phosphomannomutase
MIELLSRKGKTLAEMLSERMRLYPSSGETNYHITDPDAAIARLIDTYQPQAESRDDLDGVSLNFGNWRFNLRKSNTEPVVRLNIEADGDAALVAEKQAELAALLKA